MLVVEAAKEQPEAIQYFHQLLLLVAVEVVVLIQIEMVIPVVLEAEAV
jgi:hypothetical protein